MAAAVRARLLNRARETKQDFNLVLTRYAIERLRYRISISQHADQFLLKGCCRFRPAWRSPSRTSPLLTPASPASGGTIALVGTENDDAEDVMAQL